MRDYHNILDAACNHRYYLDRKEAGFVRKNPSGRRIAHGGYTDAVGRYIDLG